MRSIIYYLCLLVSSNVSAQCFEKVFAGEQHFIGIRQDGTMRAWGNNYHRQLGDGSTVEKSTPVTISTATDWVTVSAGRKHNFAVKTDGTLWAWGSDDGEALGNGNDNYYSVPTQIGTDTNWKQASAGESASVGIKTDGTLWTWGTNTQGYLGNGSASYTELNVPTQLGTDTDWKMVSGHGQYVLAIKNDGTLWAWGSNDYGELGIGSNIAQNTPVQVGTASDWKWIDTTTSGSAPISIAIKNNNSIWIWGADNDLLIDSNLPVQLGTDTDWKTVSVKKSWGQRYVLFTKQNGTFWAWGRDNYEQLGNDYLGSFTVPTQVGIATNWIDATAGYRQSNGIKSDGTFWAWGSTYLVANGSIPFPVQYNCMPLLSVKDWERATALQIYPNPANEIVNFSYEIDAEIFDMTGKNIMSVNASSSLDVSSFAKGIYIITTSEGIIKKLVVQ